MDNLTENLQGTANGAKAQTQTKEVAADLGKFKDVQALMSAYESLEAEFTRRSQRLKELEEKNKVQEETADAANPSAPSLAQSFSERELCEMAANSEAVKERIIGDYLKTVTSSRGAPILTGGVGVCAPSNRPATIKDAGRLAEQYFKNQLKGD